MSLRARRNQRGSALILALLVLFAVLGLGMLAMRSATQNISGAGNLRLTKQARYTAEAGLHHALTLFNRQGDNLLGRRAALGLEGSTMVIESPLPGAGVSQGNVLVLDRNGAERLRFVQAGPGFVTEGPNALGRYGEASRLIASYRVDVEGFQPWACPQDDEEASRAQGQGCCLMHFTSHGYVAREHTPNQAEQDESARQYAEHQLKAGVVLGKFSLRRCQL